MLAGVLYMRFLGDGDGDGGRRRTASGCVRCSRPRSGLGAEVCLPCGRRALALVCMPWEMQTARRGLESHSSCLASGLCCDGWRRAVVSLSLAHRVPRRGAHFVL